jgi:glycosyltransferase involved in cell wall biosynthesis
MSNANVNYLLDNNPSLNKNNIEVNPNSIYIDEEDQIKNIESNLFNRITLPEDKTIFIYGGNLGKPQGINFLLEVIIESQINPKGFFIIVGSGTEFKYVEKWFNDINPVNAILLSELNQKEYNLLLSKCHVGLVFLHPNFTIPNYPSRILNYMENSLPILFATDKYTDVGSDAENYKYGFWCENGDLIKFVSFVNYCIDNKQVLESMGKNGFERLKNEFNVDNSYQLICKRVNYNI